MYLLRGLAGALLWILSALLALVAVLLCATILLLPVGLPLLEYARRLFTRAVRLMLPRAVAHPVDTAERSAHKRGRRASKDLAARQREVTKLGHRGVKKMHKSRKRWRLV